MKKYIILLILFSVVGCASLTKPTTPPDSSHVLNVIKSFPAVLPKGSSRFEDTQLFFVHADQASELAVGLLVPVPFVTDAMMDAHKKSGAEELEKKYHALSAYEITVNTVSMHPNFQSAEGGYNLYPLLFIEECYDEVYRISLAYQLEKGDWFNRYYFHLQTTIPKAEIAEPSSSTLSSLTAELHQGAEQLLAIIKNDIDKQYVPSPPTATVGSLYIVGSKVSGVTSPNLLIYKNAEILNDAEASVVLRIPGDPKAKAKVGGMAFGIHYFDKNQLHTFKRD